MTQQEHFDVVIVGSGFGGSVMAKELAEKKLRVCLLERGKAYAPGDFPRSPAELSKAFWDPSKGLQGMFNVWSFENFGALISSGLGGGSLIYANVLLRKPKEWFEEIRDDGTRVAWPVSFEDLKPHYDRVEGIIGVHPVPYDFETHALTSKGNALREAAKRLNLTWKPAPLAITFGAKDAPLGNPFPDDGNYHARPRQTCRMCGECNIGCNYGSKNTLDHTYLSRAKVAGAEIRPRHEVKSFKRNGEMWEVEYVKHEDGKTSAELVSKTMTCKRLVLSAGALGTPYLLLKNKKNIGAAMPMLGERFCTNGDLLTVVAKSKKDQGWRKLDPSRGPVITSYIEGPAQKDGRDYIIEDAGIPDTVAWVVNTFGMVTSFKRVATLAKQWLKGLVTRDVDRDLSAEVSAFFGDSELASSSLPLLGMGRDTPNGKMSMTWSGKLQVKWRAADSGAFFPNLRKTMKDIAGALEGEFVDTPMWNLGRVITVHPLGGCPMGATEKSGVVDKNGKVFGAKNLYVADGSVMPGPVGPNPALTIAALADRFANAILAETD